MQRFQTNPLAAQQQQQILERNKAMAAQGGSPSPLGMLGSVAGGAIGTAFGGPLGGALGSSIGGSLAGKGDLSGVTPESIAMGAVTSGIGSAVGSAVGDAAKAGTEAAAEAAGDVVSEAASSTAGQLGSSAIDTSAGVVSDSWKDALGENFLWKKDIAEMAKAPGMSGKDALFEKPNSIFELGLNKITSYFEEGGEVSTEMKPFELNNPSTTADPKKKELTDLQKALMLMSPIYAMTQGNMGLGLGLGALASKADALACGGKVEH